MAKMSSLISVGLPWFHALGNQDGRPGEAREVSRRSASDGNLHLALARMEMHSSRRPACPACYLAGRPAGGPKKIVTFALSLQPRSSRNVIWTECTTS